MRILALDVGERRIGVALSNALNITAQGLETIKMDKKKDALLRIRDLAKDHGASKIIIGLPFNMDGTKGAAAGMVEEFVVMLKKETPVPIEMIDERLTTLQGERVLLEADLSRKKRKAVIDKIAAQLILQNYLDLHVQKNRP